MSFGIDVGSILEPLWHKIPSCLAILFFFCWFSGLYFDWFRSKMVSISCEWTLPFITFSTLFRRWSVWRFLGSLWLSFGYLLPRFCLFWVAFLIHLNWIFLTLKSSVHPCLQNTCRISDGDIHRKEAFPLPSPFSHLAWSGTLTARALINRCMYCLYFWHISYDYSYRLLIYLST